MKKLIADYEVDRYEVTVLDENGAPRVYRLCTEEEFLACVRGCQCEKTHIVSAVKTLRLVNITEAE